MEHSMRIKYLFRLIFALVLLISCKGGGDTLVSPMSVTMTATPSTLTTSQNLKLSASVVFTGGIGSPDQFAVRFLNGTEILIESAISIDNTASKEIPVTKAMNGTLTIKARVFRNNSTDTAVDSQPVIVTVNIP